MTEYISLVQFRTNATGNAMIGEDQPAGVTLGGNIIVIYTVLICGLGLATFGFIWETHTVRAHHYI